MKYEDIRRQVLTAIRQAALRGRDPRDIRQYLRAGPGGGGGRHHPQRAAL